METTSLPENVRLPFEANSHNITPFFKHLSILSVPDSEKAGRPIYDLKEVVELRFAGDRNYSPVFGIDEMYRKVGDRVITYAERWSDQYAAFVAGDNQKAGGTALELLQDYGITPAQLSICRALKIYSIEALHSLDGPNLKSLGMNANSLKSMARRYMEERERKVADKNGADISALQAEIKRLQALVPEKESTPAEIDAAVQAADDEYAGMNNDQLKEAIAVKVGSKPRGNPSRLTLVESARELGIVA